MKRAILIASVMMVSACGDAPQRTERVGEGLKDNYHTTADRIREWMKPTPKKEKHGVPNSYCYTSYQDILCYRQPMPGWESRLVGYQGTNAAMPPMAMMEPLPQRAPGTEMLPSNRAKTSKPLVPAAPPLPKEEENADPSKAIAVDAGHESLPDPALAPQL